MPLSAVPRWQGLVASMEFGPVGLHLRPCQAWLAPGLSRQATLAPRFGQRFWIREASSVPAEGASSCVHCAFPVFAPARARRCGGSVCERC